MKTSHKVALGTLVVLLILGVRVYFVYKARQDPGVAVKNPQPKLSSDDLAVVKELYLSTFEDAKQLEGKPVWVRAGYSLPYYPYTGDKVQFAKRVGLLPAAEKLSIVKLIKAVAPPKEDDRVPHGTKQYFAVFTLTDKPGAFATPIGDIDGEQETFYTDQIFYYDDPRTIYDNWPLSVWTAVATHTPTVGMTENQARMAVGIMLDAEPTGREGDRTVTYNDDGKKWTITFSKGLATSVKPG